MNNILTFLWLASLLISLFYATHYFLLRKEKAFRFNRLYLVGGVLIAFVLPIGIISGISFLQLSATAPIAGLSEQIVALPVYTLNGSAQPAASWLWEEIILAVYFAGLAVAALQLLFRLIQLRTYLQRLRFKPTADGYYLAEEPGKQSSFSFFRYIIINPTEAANAEEYAQILQHEKAHAAQKHSYDILLIEVAKVFLWFLPTVYWLRNSLQEVHEYLADEDVMGKQLTDPSYIKLMARISLRAAGLPVTSPFNQFSTLNRIRMIQKTRKPNFYRLSAGLLLAAGLSVFMACQKEEDAFALEEEFPAEITLNEQTTASEDGIFEVVDDHPVPSGDMKGFYEALSQELVYPAAAKEAGIEGRVFIQFVVQVDGSLKDMMVIKGVSDALDAEALRAFQALNLKWEPGRKDGKAVPVRMVMPISFQL